VCRKSQETEKPLATLINHRINHPVGTGPFTLEAVAAGGLFASEEQPPFFRHRPDHQRPHDWALLDDLVYTVFGTSDVAILALKKGSIDMFWWPIQPGYMADLSRQEDIRLFTNEKSALYFMGFNLRRPPFDDHGLRRAVAYLIDKDFIIFADSSGAWHQDVFGGAG
jgi:peptide/nickel transport system substrate-binding protein